MPPRVRLKVPLPPPPTKRAPRAKLTKPAKEPPALAKPVEGRWVFANGQRQYENWQWAPYLLKEIEGEPGDYPRRIGLNPFQIPASVLIKAGHVRRPASMAMRAYARDMGWEPDHDRDRGLHRLRALCLDCSAGRFKDVKDCACFNCPLWAHRMGKSPFNVRADKSQRLA